MTDQPKPSDLRDVIARVIHTPKRGHRIGYFKDCPACHEIADAIIPLLTDALAQATLAGALAQREASSHHCLLPSFAGTPKCACGKFFTGNAAMIVLAEPEWKAHMLSLSLSAPSQETLDKLLADNDEKWIDAMGWTDIAHKGPCTQDDRKNYVNLTVDSVTYNNVDLVAMETAVDVLLAEERAKATAKARLEEAAKWNEELSGQHPIYHPQHNRFYQWCEECRNKRMAELQKAAAERKPSRSETEGAK